MEGKAKNAIYDLNNRKLYHVDKEMVNLVRKSFTTNITDREEKDLKPLVDSGIIEKSDCKYDEVPISSLKEDIKPNFAWLEITQQCNLRCTFCYEKSDASVKKFMSMEDFEIAKTFLIEYGVKRIQFIGGEPMLHPKLKDMILSSKQHFDFIEVYTNGNFINQEWCDFFKEHNVNVALSIHSYIDTEHDKITRVQGSHELVDKSIKLLIKNEIKYRLAAIMNKDIKMGEKPENCEYAIHGSPPRLVGRCSIDQYNLEIFKRRAITKNYFKSSIYKSFIKKTVSGHQCFSRNFYIAWDLEVFPCVMERRISHGSIRNKNSVNEDIFRKYSKDHIEGCKDCELRYACYDCRPDAGGQPILAKPWYCTYDQNNGTFSDIEEHFEKVKKAENINSHSVEIQKHHS